MGATRHTPLPAASRRSAATAFLFASLLLPGCAAVHGTARPAPPAAGDRWARATSPAKGAPEAIGSPAAGCLRGAASLPPDGPGFRVMRISRKRFYGHPALLAELREVGAHFLSQTGGTLLVGDLSMPRGGPMTDAHGSHQTGLDADVWFSLSEELGGERPLTLDERENLPAGILPDGKLDWKRAEMVRLFASRPSVERLFVAPAFKRELCRVFPSPGDVPWLGKVRPWHGHEDHLHLRVACPADSPACVPGRPIPEGNGCDGTLDWWFGEEARAEGKAPRPRKEPILPDACLPVLEAPG